MLRTLLTAGLTVMLALTSALSAQAPKPAAGAPAAGKPAAGNIVTIDTLKGQIQLETLPGDAPKSVQRFIELAKQGFYREQRFHWVQANLIQAGDPLSRDMSKMDKWGSGGSGPRNVLRPLGVAEPSKRPFNRGMVGLAYTTGTKPENADSQFFIIKQTSPNLNGKYAVIGRVTKGMDVVDKIERLDAIKMLTVK